MALLHVQYSYQDEPITALSSQLSCMVQNVGANQNSPHFTPRASGVSIGVFMFSFKNSTLPCKFNNLFLMNSQIHNYNTGNAHSFRLPLCRTKTRLFSFYFKGPKFCISLNSIITGSSSCASFKRKFKEFFLSMY